VPGQRALDHVQGRLDPLALVVLHEFETPAPDHLAADQRGQGRERGGVEPIRHHRLGLLHRSRQRRARREQECQPQDAPIHRFDSLSCTKFFVY
jgi:hypothetical protein